MKKYELPTIEFSFFDKNDVISPSNIDTPFVDGDDFFKE